MWPAPTAAEANPPLQTSQCTLRCQAAPKRPQRATDVPRHSAASSAEAARAWGRTRRVVLDQVEESRMDEPNLMLQVLALKTHFFLEEGIARAVDGASFHTMSRLRPRSLICCDDLRTQLRAWCVHRFGHMHTGGNQP